MFVLRRSFKNTIVIEVTSKSFCADNTTMCFGTPLVGWQKNWLMDI